MIIAEILTVIGGVAAFFTGRRIRRHKEETDVMKSMQSAYDAFVKHAKSENNCLREQHKVMLTEIKLLKAKVDALEKTIKKFSAENKALKLQIAKYESKK